MPSNQIPTRRGLVAIATLALCVLVPSAVRAESETEKKQRAKERYEIATRLYDVGKYGEAIGEYEQAYLLTGDAALLFNIGQAYRLWDRPEDAIRAYKNYLRQRPEATNRADVEKKLSDLEKVVEERRRGSGTPPPAEAPRSPAPALPAPPPYAAPPVPVAGAEPSPAAPESPPAGLVVASQAASEPARPGQSWLVYPLLGVSGACLVTAVVAATVGASKARKVQDASQKGQAFDPAVESNGKTANALAVVFGLAAVAAGGAGGYLLWRGHRAARPSVAVVPALAPSFAGGSALLTF